MAAVGRAFDWGAVQRDYETGCFTNRELAKKYGLSHTAINKKTKAEGWTRPLKEKIRARADRLVEEQIAQEAVVSTQPGDGVSRQVSTETGAFSEDARTDLNARVQAEIRGRQRRDIVRARDLCTKLLRELEAETDPEVLERISSAIVDETGEDAAERPPRLAMLKAISLPSRAAIMDKLASALAKLVALERQAYGIDKEEPQDWRAGLRELLYSVPLNLDGDSAPSNLGRT